RIVERTYSALTRATNRPSLFVASSYHGLAGAFTPLARSGVEAIGLDLVHGQIPDGVGQVDLSGVTLVAGVVDGHNVWRTDLDAAQDTITALREAAGDGAQVAVATSTSLFHVPHTVAKADQLQIG